MTQVICLLRAATDGSLGSGEGMSDDIGEGNAESLSFPTPKLLAERDRSCNLDSSSLAVLITCRDFRILHVSLKAFECRRAWPRSRRRGKKPISEGCSCH